VQNFLGFEIDKNFNILRNPNLNTRLENDIPTQYSYIPEVSFDEFDKVKYELLKYDSELIKETFEIYNMFRVFAKYSDFNQYRMNDYNTVRATFLKYRTKHIS